MASNLGLNASHPEMRCRTGGGNVPQPKTAAAGRACRRGGWIHGNRGVLCAGPGGESDTIAIVHVEPVDHHTESDCLPEHVARLSGAPPSRRPGRGGAGLRPPKEIEM